MYEIIDLLFLFLILIDEFFDFKLLKLNKIEFKVL